MNHFVPEEDFVGFMRLQLLLEILFLIFKEGRLFYKVTIFFIFAQNSTIQPLYTKRNRCFIFCPIFTSCFVVFFQAFLYSSDCLSFCMLIRLSDMSM